MGQIGEMGVGGQLGACFPRELWSFQFSIDLVQGKALTLHMSLDASTDICQSSRINTEMYDTGGLPPTWPAFCGYTWISRALASE